MKLQNKILNNYGSLVRDLDIEERETNEIIDVLLKFKDDADSKSSVALSLKHIKKINPTLLELKMKFLKC